MISLEYKKSINLALFLYFLIFSADTVIAENDPMVSFDKEVFPILKEHCSSCHLPEGKGYELSGLSLLNYQSLMEGGNYGPILIPKNPKGSILSMVISGETEMGMPHKRKTLSTHQIKTINSWIDQGAHNN